MYVGSFLMFAYLRGTLIYICRFTLELVITQYGSIVYIGIAMGGPAL